jgi:hypothetical protein
MRGSGQLVTLMIPRNDTRPTRWLSPWRHTGATDQAYEPAASARPPRGDPSGTATRGESGRSRRTSRCLSRTVTSYPTAPGTGRHERVAVSPRSLVRDVVPGVPGGEAPREAVLLTSSTAGDPSTAVLRRTTTTITSDGRRLPLRLEAVRSGHRAGAGSPPAEAMESADHTLPGARSRQSRGVGSSRRAASASDGSTSASSGLIASITRGIGTSRGRLDVGRGFSRARSEHRPDRSCEWLH